MRILITTDVYKTMTSGVTESVKNLYNELKGLGNEVKILTVSDDLTSYVDGDIVYIRSLPLPIYKGIRMPISYRHALINDIIKWKPDIIHTQSEFFTYQYALYISKMTSSPIVHTYHTMYEDYVNYVLPWKKIGRKMVKNFIKYRLKKAKRVIVPSEKIAKMLKKYPISSPISVIPTGIDLQKHSRKKISDVSVRRGYSDGLFLLVYLGRLSKEKNIEEIIEFFAEAVKIIPETALLIVGDGPQMDALTKLVEELALEDRVLFTGKVAPELVPEYYQCADLFVSASTSETQGLTYIEACANGLPLLCRKDDALLEVIAEGQNGYTYENEDEFLFYLKKIVENPSWRAEASKMSRKISELFDREDFGRSVEKLYKENI